RRAACRRADERPGAGDPGGMPRGGRAGIPRQVERVSARRRRHHPPRSCIGGRDMETLIPDVVAPATTPLPGSIPGAPKRRRYAGTGPTGQDIDGGDWMRSLGRQIRRTREFLHLSQETLAATAGISQGAMSRLETGRGIGTPLVVVLRVQLVLTGLLSDVDP